jgi:hypothetical protein
MPIRIRGLHLPAKLTGILPTPAPAPEPEPIPEVVLPVYEPEPVVPYVSTHEESDDDIVVPKKPKTKITNRTVALNPLSDS